MKTFNEKGVSVVEAIIAAGILGIVMMMTTSATMHSGTVSGNKNSSQTQVLLSVRRQIAQLINDDFLWIQTAARGGTNSALNCTNVNTLISCVTTPVPLNLDLVDETGAVTFYEKGFTYSGQDCATTGQAFSAAGNDLCPFKYVVTYQITCPVAPSPCYFPLVEIAAQLKYSPQAQDGVGFNLAQFQINSFMRTTSTNPSAHVYECFQVSYGGGPAPPLSNGGAKVINPGNTWPPVTLADGQAVFVAPTGTTSGDPHSIWAVQCVPGWQARGCTISEPVASGFPDMDHWLDGNTLGTGCFSDNHIDPIPGSMSEWTANATLSTSCCRLR